MYNFKTIVVAPGNQVFHLWHQDDPKLIVDYFGLNYEDICIISITPDRIQTKTSYFNPDKWMVQVQTSPVPTWLDLDRVTMQARGILKQTMDVFFIRKGDVGIVDNGRFFVFGKSHVELHGNAFAYALDKAVVVVRDRATVKAYNEVEVVAHDNSCVMCFDQSKACLYDCATAVARNTANITLYGRTVTTLHDESTGDANEHAEIYALDESHAIMGNYTMAHLFGHSICSLYGHAHANKWSHYVRIRCNADTVCVKNQIIEPYREKNTRSQKAMSRSHVHA